MDTTLIVVLVVAVIAFEAFLRLTSRKNKRGSDDDDLQGFPYELQKRFLSPAELSFFQNLRSATGNRAVVCTKVRLGDVFWVNLENSSKFLAYRNKIDRKHVDFLICDPASMRPLVGIELDDSSHQRSDRQARDAFVDGVFEAADLPLLHIPVKRAFVTAEIEAQITPYLDVPTPPVRTSVSAPVAHQVEAPRCPKCGSEMILRTAKSGPNAGKKFWGCSTYPECRGMVAYNAQGA